MTAPARPKAGTRGFWRSLRRSFVAGVLLLAPLAVTGLIVFNIVAWFAARSSFGLWIGLALALVLILLVGWISRTALGSLLSLADDALAKVPGLGLVYGYVRDMVQSLAGNEQRFRQPVWVYPYPRSRLRMIGFVTREDLSALGAKGDIAVFLAYAYSISGVVVVLPRSQVKPLKTRSKDLLAFVATGGLAGGHAPKPGEGREG